MINNSEFAERLTKIMGFYQLSAAAFADKIQVPRSTISHLLSGRNKPSLDFVLKVVKEYKEVELYWLLNGKGVFPRSSGPAPTQDQVVKKDASAAYDNADQDSIEINTLKKKIERIVIFFDDGTFKEYVT